MWTLGNCSGIASRTFLLSMIILISFDRVGCRFARVGFTDRYLPRPQKTREQSRPSGLMRRADAATGLAVEVFVEQNVVAEMGIGLQLLVVAEHGAFAR